MSRFKKQAKPVPSHYFIVDEKHVIGPFPSVGDAVDWISAPHRLEGKYRVIHLYGSMPPMGTMETAHHAGTVVAISDVEPQPRPDWFLPADWDRCTDSERQEILADKQAYLDGKAIGGFKEYGNTHS